MNSTRTRSSGTGWLDGPPEPVAEESAYLVVDTDWKDTNTETRAACGRTAQPDINSDAGRFLTPSGGRNEPLEGDWHPQILTIIEFPDAETARQMWNAPEFRAAAIGGATDSVFKVVLVASAAP